MQLTRLQVLNHVQGVLVGRMRQHLAQSGEVEGVLNVAVIDLAEELVASEAAKPRDPGHLIRAGHRG